MRIHRFRLIAGALLLALFAGACSASSSEVVVGSEQAQQPTTATAATGAASDSGQAAEAPAAATTNAQLATSPLDYAVISAGQISTPTAPIPCQLAGQAVADFAANRGLPLRQVTGNNCHWAEGPINSIDIHFREIAEIDVAERRRLHGADDTVIDQDGPGAQAASYLDSNGQTDRYFFVSGTRAVFLVAETSPAVTEAELRAMADEIATVIGSAVDEGQYWSDAGDFGEDALCTVWSADVLAQLFGAVVATPSSNSGCDWWIEGDDYAVHQVTLGIDLFDTIEIHTRNGGSAVSIGDRAAALSEDTFSGTLRQISFVVNGNAFNLTVESETHSALADVLAANLVARLS